MHCFRYYLFNKWNTRLIGTDLSFNPHSAIKFGMISNKFLKFSGCQLVYKRNVAQSGKPFGPCKPEALLPNPETPGQEGRTGRDQSQQASWSTKPLHLCAGASSPPRDTGAAGGHR